MPAITTNDIKTGMTLELDSGVHRSAAHRAPVTYAGYAFDCRCFSSAITVGVDAVRDVIRSKRLHRFGIHYIWLIFANSYIGRALAMPEYIPAAAIVVIRLTSWGTAYVSSSDFG